MVEQRDLVCGRRESVTQRPRAEQRTVCPAHPDVVDPSAEHAPGTHRSFLLTCACSPAFLAFRASSRLPISAAYVLKAHQQKTTKTHTRTMSALTSRWRRALLPFISHEDTALQSLLCMQEGKGDRVSDQNRHSNGVTQTQDEISLIAGENAHVLSSISGQALQVSIKQNT